MKHLKRVLLLILAFGYVFCGIAQVEQRIFIVDCSGSMAGYGDGSQQKIFSSAKKDLANYLSTQPDSVKTAVIPFCSSAMPSFCGTPKDASSFVSNLKIQRGNTDISAGWSEAAKMLTQDRKTAIILITDAKSNIGSTEKLFNAVKDFSSSAGRTNFAYLYAPTPMVENSELAQLFKSNAQMDLTKTFDVNPFEEEQVTTTKIDTFSKAGTIVLNQDTGNYDFRWIVYLLIIILIVAIVLALYFLLPYIAAGFDNMPCTIPNIFSPLRKPIIKSCLGYGRLPLNGYNWSGKRGNSFCAPDPKDTSIPNANTFYDNPDHLTRAEICKKYKIKGVKYVNGEPVWPKKIISVR